MDGLELWIGNDGSSWRGNARCNTGISLRLRGPTVSNCEGIGRFLFIVIPVRNAILSLCEVEVIPAEILLQQILGTIAVQFGGICQIDSSAI